MSGVHLGKIIVFVAIDKEHEAVCNKLGATHTHLSDDDSPYECGSWSSSYGTWQVFICQTGDGNANAAAVVAKAIAELRPHLSVYCGIAGGVKDAALGDVVVGEAIYFYERVKETDGGSYSRPKDTRPANFRLLQMAQVAARNAKRNGKNYQIFQKPIAAGNSLVATSSGPVRERLALHFNDAIAVEMEGSGYMLSTHIFDIPALVIRGISDLLDRKSETDADGRQELAAANAADFTFEVLNQFPRAPGAGASPEARLVQWDQALATLRNLQREIDIVFQPDVVLTMSGPGSWAPFFGMSLRTRNVPILAAVTFPTRTTAQPELDDFRSSIQQAGWIEITTQRWVVFIPDIFDNLRKDANVLLFDDRVITGHTQFKVRELLGNRGFANVRTAALYSKSTDGSKPSHLDFVGNVFNGDFEMPWGRDHGRI